MICTLLFFIEYFGQYIECKNIFGTSDIKYGNEPCV